MTNAARTMLWLMLAACGAPAIARHDSPTLVLTKSGALRGSLQDGIVSFKGIPYAAPPVGALRWRPPQPEKPWRGVREADRVGAICEQKYQPADNGVGPLPISEDCLTLNVFARADAKAEPVMFWIHGGGFVNGSGTAALYDGTALARQGVVVVTINYRLGRFGFFAHPALTAEARGRPTGNFGIMDMIAALKWVRGNISRFGGDPHQVTIFGESAGGIAVNDLMVSPAARGLFARAIAESGLGREPAPRLADAESAGVAFARSLGLDQPSARDLRNLSPEQILKAGDPDLMKGGGSMIDGQILTIAPAAGFKAGREADVPYIVGWNSLEFPVPAPDPGKPVPPILSLDAESLKRIAAAYPTLDSYKLNLLSDVLFVEPAYNLARLHAGHGRVTRVYQFSVVPKAARSLFKGAPHAFERQYVFETLHSSPVPTDGNDAAQAAAMSAYWVSFAKTGDPNGGGRPEWPLFSGSRPEIMDFTSEGPKPRPISRPAALAAISNMRH